MLIFYIRHGLINNKVHNENSIRQSNWLENI